MIELNLWFLSLIIVSNIFYAHLFLLTFIQTVFQHVYIYFNYNIYNVDVQIEKQIVKLKDCEIGSNKSTFNCGKNEFRNNRKNWKVSALI